MEEQRPKKPFDQVRACPAEGAKGTLSVSSTIPSVQNRSGKTPLDRG